MSTEAIKISLLRAMLKCVREGHFSDITVNMICERSHVSRRTFYRYYSDKEALLRDVFVECFFSKIEVTEDDDFWDIFAKVCEQIYSDTTFFKHALEAKGQNGFWEEVSSILSPYYSRHSPSYGFLIEMKEFYISTEISRLLVLIENWIKSGMTTPPDEFAYSIRVSYYIYGLWTSQIAAKQEVTEFTSEVYSDLYQYIKDHDYDSNHHPDPQ